MKQSGVSHALPHNLALVCLGLAYRPSDRLGDAELDVIAAHLQRWQALTRDEAVSAVKEALDDFSGAAPQDKIETAIQAIADAVPHGRRQDLLDDLVGMALTDGTFLSEEGAFIGRLARSWDVHPVAGHAPAHQSWSLIESDVQQEGWTAIHDLTLVYLTLAHKTDQELHRAEIEAITRKVSEWLPDMQDEAVLAIVREALRVYAERWDAEAFARAVRSVRDAVPEHQRRALLADLHYVANADGVMLIEEKEMIARLAKAWGISSDA